jgi:hypothetical protein
MCFSKKILELLVFEIISSARLWKVGSINMNMNTFQRGILYSLVGIVNCFNQLITLILYDAD